MAKEKLEPKWYYALVSIHTGRVLYSGSSAIKVATRLHVGRTFARHENVDIAIHNAKEHASRWAETKRKYGI